MLSSPASTQPPSPAPRNSVQHADEQSSDVVLHAIVEARGNHKLALDTLRTQHGLDLSINDLVAMLHDRLPELKEQMEVVTTLELFSLMPQLHKTLTENLSNLEGGEAVRAYMDLMQLIQKATKKDELNININDMRWKLVPRDLANLYAQLEASGQLEQIALIDHDPNDRVA